MKHTQHTEISPMEQRFRRPNLDVILMSGLLIFLLAFVVCYFLA